MEIALREKLLKGEGDEEICFQTHLRLINIFMNDFGIEETFCKHVDDTKLCRGIKTLSGNS